MDSTKGSFTLPGESGYEKLTLQMAEKWGADVIRDSDGTQLSDEILDAGYGIYSTICMIREHNEWGNSNPDKLQQCFLMTEPVVYTGEEPGLTIALMADFFEEQFRVNDTPEAYKYWQVYDRTDSELVGSDKWEYDKTNGCITIHAPEVWHRYTVSFLAYRIWEEISMYNHTTNNWDKEHLLQIDPVYPEAREYLTSWMKNWCETHPATTVVRFTSMFYNFVWIWGSSPLNRNRFTDWGSYDFTVSAKALDDFALTYGYSLTAEDFVNQGYMQVTHMPGNSRKTDWMNFINDFVISFGKELIDMVHAYGKQAYVFYDDSWVGIEPYNGRFQEFGFDGLIKCVFSGYEARLCAGVKVNTHELRLHPYLFPVGLGGAPTFMDGGDPTLEAKKYWNSVRRALLREPVERIGLGGYLHLVEAFPDFCDYIETVANEFRTIRQFHAEGKPYTVKTRVAVLHHWGKLRSWTLSGHFHETYKNDLIHINEALAGLPVDVSFISFDDVRNGALEQADVVINAGFAGSAWSGGDVWKDTEIVDRLTRFVYEGGALIGVGEPSAADGADTFLRMAHVLGVDEDTGARICHGRWQFEVSDASELMPHGSFVRLKGDYRKGVPYLTDGTARVLAAQDELPIFTMHSFGKGMGIYLSSFEVCPENTRLLLNLIMRAGGEDLHGVYLTDNAYTECAYYPGSRQLVVINNSGTAQTTDIPTEHGTVHAELEAYETRMYEV